MQKEYKEYKDMKSYTHESINTLYSALRGSVWDLQVDCGSRLTITPKILSICTQVGVLQKKIHFFLSFFSIFVKEFSHAKTSRLVHRRNALVIKFGNRQIPCILAWKSCTFPLNLKISVFQQNTLLDWLPLYACCHMF